MMVRVSRRRVEVPCSIGTTRYTLMYQFSNVQSTKACSTLMSCSSCMWCVSHTQVESRPSPVGGTQTITCMLQCSSTAVTMVGGVCTSTANVVECSSHNLSPC